MVTEVPDPDLRQARDHPLSAAEARAGQAGPARELEVRVPVDVLAYRHLRRRARLASLGFALVATWLVYLVVVMSGRDDPRAAILPYLLLFGLGAAAWWALRGLWRRSYAARPVVLSADAGPGALIGVPELDEPPRPHRSRTGEIDPPARW
ncbi:MAG: hypothetical protein ACYCTH_05940 [Cellulomonas sp.]